jgi:deazaflavin-dependent oxidoreductase (nitroreductase family)
MIYYFPHQGSYVIVGSNVGSDRHPAWYLNLQADLVAEVQIGRESKKVVARTAEGEERDRLWSEIVEKDPSYAEYQSRTDRQFPVVILDPVERR